MIGDWAAELTTVLEDVAGVEQVHQYDDLPSQIVASPTLIWMPIGGRQSYGLSAPAVAIHRVQITLYIKAALLPEGVGLAVPFIAKVRDALAANIQLSGTVSYILPSPEDDFYQGPAYLAYGEKVHTGINFFVNVKEVENLTVSA